MCFTQGGFFVELAYRVATWATLEREEKKENSTQGGLGRIVTASSRRLFSES